MFHRGQRIVITESSGSGRAHPAKGDLGYLNNMYFFYKDRFILMDAFFFAYKSDLKNGTSRCERKKFIIDLGMSKRLKHRLGRVGVRKKLFTNNKYVINLFSTGHWEDDEGIFVDTPGIRDFYGPWPFATKNSIVKIPMGHIAAAPAKYALQKRNRKEIEAWARCIWPMFDAQLMNHDVHALIPRKVKELRPSIKKWISSSAMGGGFRFFLINFRGIEEAIDMLRLVQILSSTYVDKSDFDLLKAMRAEPSITHIAKAWKYDGMESLVSNQNIDQYHVQCLIVTVIRSFLFARNPEERLASVGRCLPWGDKVLHYKAVKFGKIRRCVNSGSASLARIYEEKLLD